MNGRVYDPVIARFLSPDPIIQAPKMSESYNRYSYVMNNPLYFTDPSGYSWISKKWKQIRRAAITIGSFAIDTFAGCPVCGIKLGAVLATTSYTYRNAKDKGASTSSALGSALKAGATAAVMAQVSGAIGDAHPVLGAEGSLSNLVPNLVAHGMASAVAAGINGGNPADGFKWGVIGAGIGKGVSSLPVNPNVATVAAATVAGAIAEAQGGDPFFAFSMAAIQHYYNARGKENFYDGLDKDFINDFKSQFPVEHSMFKEYAKSLSTTMISEDPRHFELAWRGFESYASDRGIELLSLSAQDLASNLYGLKMHSGLFQEGLAWQLGMYNDYGTMNSALGFQRLTDEVLMIRLNGPQMINENVFREAFGRGYDPSLNSLVK